MQATALSLPCLSRAVLAVPDGDVRQNHMLRAGIIPWKVISYAATFFFGACIVGSVCTGGALVAPAFLLFFLPSLYLILFFGDIRISDIGLEMNTPVGQHSIDWKEVTAIEFGQSHIVLTGQSKRLVIPQFTFWSPKSQKIGAETFREIAATLGITPQYRYSADFKISKNTKRKCA
jgi:hypothetical protein